jgi:hypothetical protein
MNSVNSAVTAKALVYVNMRKTIQVLGASFGLSLLLSLPVFSQLNLGRILGAITDQSGGAIAGATVTVVDVARGVSRPLTTDGAGEYNAPGLTPGTYTVRAEAKGFRTVERQNVVLGVGGDVRVDVTLQPGEQAQTITVTEALPIVNTTNATLGGTVENQQLSDLPIHGRQFVKLLDYQPGVLALPGGDSFDYSSNGARVQDQVWMLDGIDDIDAWSAAGPIVGQQQADILPVDAIQEVKVIENPNAQYGWKPGAVVDTGLKSGTNNIHGTAYTYDRNTALDAKNAFLAGQPKALDELWNYGASIGGPIKKDKLFYFGAYEGELFAVGQPSVVQVPSSLAGQGITNSVPDAIADINAQHLAGTKGTTTLSTLSLNLAGCDATKITTSMTTGAAVAPFCNPTNGVMNNGTNNINLPFAPNDEGHSNSFITKVDYHLNDHNALNGEYFFGRGDEFNPSSIHDYWSEASPQYTQSTRAVWVWTPNSTWVNEARFGHDMSSGPTFPEECINNLGQPNYASAFGYTPGTPSNPAGCHPFAPVTIGSFTSMGSDSGGGAWSFGIWTGVDTVSYTRGKHLFKFGGELSVLRFTGAGKLTNLTGSTTFAGGDAFNASTPLEDFLTGIPDSGTLLLGSPTRHITQNRYAGFVQDDWRVTRRVIVNLGLRYEYTAPIVERNNNLGNFDPNSATGLVQQANGHAVYNGDPKNFGPRLGVAWDVTGKGTTVVRVGGSLVYMNFIAFNELLQSPNGSQLQAIPTGFTLYNANGTTRASPGNIAVGTATLFGPTITSGQINWAANTPIFNSGGSALVCANGLTSVVIGGVSTTPAPCAINVINQNFRPGYTSTWTLAVQHAFTSGLSLNLAYVGTHGTDLGGTVDINAAPPGVKNSVSPIQTKRPYYNQFPYLSNIRYLTDNLESNYDALQANLTERVTHGLTFNAGYTLSHCLDDYSGETNTKVMDNTRPGLDYGNCNYDAPNHFTLTGSYTIPGKKSPGQLLEGWQINSAVSLLSAFPFNATDTNSDISGTGQKADRWTLLGPASAFSGAGGAGAIPCFGVTKSSFQKAGCITVATVANLPAACVTAATNEQFGTTPNPATPGDKNATGLLALGNFGCYYENGSAIVPPAQGTFGDMARNILRGKPFREWDFSAIKDWKFKERYTAQFRAEFYNILNSVEYAVPSGNPNSPSTFGQAQQTPNAPASGPVNRSGGPRLIQLGLKFIF